MEISKTIDINGDLEVTDVMFCGIGPPENMYNVTHVQICIQSTNLKPKSIHGA